MTERILQRKIDRARARLSTLLEREEHLSKHGYWEIGYLKGQLNVMEDWLDDMKEG